VARRVEVTGWGTLRDSELNSLHSSDVSALMHALVVHICTYEQQVKLSSLSSISVGGNIISANQVVLHCHYSSLLNSLLLLRYHIPPLNVSQKFNLLLTSQNMILATVLTASMNKGEMKRLGGYVVMKRGFERS
jgi:hypothetical protein